MTTIKTKIAEYTLKAMAIAPNEISAETNKWT
jgi:hypothetical protein